MKEIKIDCFLEKEICQVVSPITKFEINNPFEKEFILEINNHSQNNCQLFLTAKKFTLDNFSAQTSLIILSEERVISEGSLENFFKQKINLNIINAKNTKKYFFNFDFSNLYFKNEKTSLVFDFLLDFDCAELQTAVLQVQTSSAAVLAASTSNNLEIIKQPNQIKNYFWHEPLFYMLSSLCVISFFVIMKIVHGKKKNKA